MSKQNSWFLAVARTVAIASGLLITATAGYATENAQERRGARDVKQDTRQDARGEKAECRAADDKSNAACRQDKRSTKQDGREESRDVRSGATPKP